MTTLTRLVRSPTLTGRQSRSGRNRNTIAPVRDHDSNINRHTFVVLREHLRNHRHLSTKVVNDQSSRRNPRIATRPHLNPLLTGNNNIAQPRHPTRTSRTIFTTSLGANLRYLDVGPSHESRANTRTPHPSTRVRRLTRLKLHANLRFKVSRRTDRVQTGRNMRFWLSPNLYHSFHRPHTFNLHRFIRPLPIDFSHVFLRPNLTKQRRGRLSQNLSPPLGDSTIPLNINQCKHPSPGRPSLLITLKGTPPNKAQNTNISSRHVSRHKLIAILNPHKKNTRNRHRDSRGDLRRPSTSA